MYFRETRAAVRVGEGTSAACFCAKVWTTEIRKPTITANTISPKTEE